MCVCGRDREGAKKFVCVCVFMFMRRQRERERGGGEIQNDCTKWYVCPSTFSHHNFCTQSRDELRSDKCYNALGY